MFEIPAQKTQRGWSVPLAMLGELSVVVILVLMPVKGIKVVPDLVSKIVLVAPSPPPPALPAGVRPEPLKNVTRKFYPVKLMPLIAPRAIPKEISIAEAPEIIGGMPGGVPGGVPGGIAGGALDGILKSLPSMAPPPPPVAAVPPKPAPPSRVSVGGNVQAGLLLYQVTPVYPPIARTTRITGTVRLKAIIGCDGKVKELALIGGHPMLILAAEEAVRQWVYKPTLLNGLPVEVETEITVKFTLA